MGERDIILALEKHRGYLLFCFQISKLTGIRKEHLRHPLKQMRKSKQLKYFEVKRPEEIGKIIKKYRLKLLLPVDKLSRMLFCRGAYVYTIKLVKK